MEEMRNVRVALKAAFKLIGMLCALIAIPLAVCAQTAKPAWQADWDKTIELAKKEGKVVVSLPASAELRAGIEKLFEKRYGIDVEPIVGRASMLVRKMIDESKAGVRYVDLHMGGSESVVTGMLPEGVVDPLEPYMLLPEVRDPKQWWGGHIWVDNPKKFVYATLAYQSESLWFNSQLMKAEDVRSFDDLLDEKLIGKIGILDPRTPGSGASMWSYLREVKGEDYLRKLVGQKLSLSRDQRVLAEILAKGKIALVLGLTYYSYAPFIKAGSAGSAASRTQGRCLCQRRQRPSGGPQERASSPCHQAFSQLVHGPGRPGSLYQGNASTDATA